MPVHITPIPTVHSIALIFNTVGSLSLPRVKLSKADYM